MLTNKKGLSTIVTTLIIILLVLVAIGIIWVVVRNVIETGTTAVDYSVKCLAVDVRAQTAGVNCTADGTTRSNCTVILARKAGGDNIGGVKMVFYNATTSTSVLDSRNFGVTNIAPLTTAKTNIINMNLTSPNKVAITVYFSDEAGEDQICGQTNPMSFTSY